MLLEFHVFSASLHIHGSFIWERFTEVTLLFCLQVWPDGPKGFGQDVRVCMLSHSDMSDSMQLYGLQPTRLLCPWRFSRQEYWSGLPCPPPGMQIDGQWEFAVWLRELKLGLCNNLEGWGWAGGGGEIQEAEDICTPMVNSCWCMTEIKSILYTNHQSIKNNKLFFNKTFFILHTVP